MSSDKKDEEMICALTADEYAALQKGLDELPETMPPRDVWQRIREQADAEGLLSQPGRSRIWYLGVGIAAGPCRGDAPAPVLKAHHDGGEGRPRPRGARRRLRR